MLWTAPELMPSQRAGGIGLSMGTQKGDVYSFAIVLHEILYRAGLFHCVQDDEPIPAKSMPMYTIEKSLLDRYFLIIYFYCTLSMYAYS